MEYYINKTSNGARLPALHKVTSLVIDGATVIKRPLEWEEGLVCVVNNGPFEAAAYIYSSDELETFSDPSDSRPKTWLKYPHAEDMAE